MLEALHHKWGNSVVTGDMTAMEPEIAEFKHSDKAVEILRKHFNQSKNIAIHCDVDMDGIGSGYIMGKFMGNQTDIKPLYIINKEKVHGIQQKHADLFATKKIDLLIIVDSSSNELEIIKQFNCDVVVIDHHELGHEELCGKTNSGHDFVIVNNTISNGDIFQADDKMSCGVVVYELLRLYSRTYEVGKVLEHLRLFQWAGVTLLTDAILLNTPRNQWYMEKTVHSREIESTLYSLLVSLNKYKILLDRSVINYTIAPVINKAVRAGHSGEALTTVIFNPSDVEKLLIYGKEQDSAVELSVKYAVEQESYIYVNLTDLGINRNYAGVIAGKLCGSKGKNAIVYVVNNGVAEGSFRGRKSAADYRTIIDSFDDTTWAQGHKAAFGFKMTVEKIDAVMNELRVVESQLDSGYYLTAGKLNEINPGKFTITDMDEFKRQGGLVRLSIGNSKLSNEEQIMITVSTSDVRLEEIRGKLYIYNVLGLSCKAFAPISTEVVDIYAEYSKQIDCYIK